LLNQEPADAVKAAKKGRPSSKIWTVTVLMLEEDSGHPEADENGIGPTNFVRTLQFPMDQPAWRVVTDIESTFMRFGLRGVFTIMSRSTANPIGFVLSTITMETGLHRSQR
jgi:hypothetical protein